MYKLYTKHQRLRFFCENNDESVAVTDRALAADLGLAVLELVFDARISLLLLPLRHQTLVLSHLGDVSTIHDVSTVRRRRER